MDTDGISRDPGARGISTYSNVFSPLSPEPNGRTVSETSGGNASKSGGRSSSGDGIARMLPSPETRTVSVTASFASTESRSRLAETSRAPTTPLNGSGAPSGSGSTSMVSPSETTPTGTLEPPKRERPPKNRSKGSLERVRTWASSTIGSIERRPAPVGTSATLRITALAYVWPSRSSCSTRGWPAGVTSSTQKPSGSGTRVKLKELTSTRVQIRYSTTNGSPSCTRVFVACAVMKRSSAPTPVRGAPDVGPCAETVTSSGSVRRLRPPATTPKAGMRNVPSDSAWYRYWRVSEIDWRPLTNCIDVCVLLPRYWANALRSGSSGSSSICWVPVISTPSTNGEPTPTSGPGDRYARTEGA